VEKGCLKVLECPMVAVENLETSTVVVRWLGGWGVGGGQ